MRGTVSGRYMTGSAHAAWAFALAVLLGACEGPPGYGGRTWLCESDDDCPAGMTCAGTECRAPVAGFDATVDTAPPGSDAPGAPDVPAAPDVPNVADTQRDMGGGEPDLSPDTGTAPDECSALGQRQCEGLALRACERAADGHLVWGPATSCDDEELCTTDSCDPAVGCVNEANDAACGEARCEGLTFFAAGLCRDGACEEPVGEDCQGDSPCREYGCEPDSACAWTAAHEGEACEIGDELTRVCRHGDCAPACTEDGQCDDGIACTEDRCDHDVGACANEPDDSVCDDGERCKTNICDPERGCVITFNTELCRPASCDGMTFYDEVGCEDGACPEAVAEACENDNPCTTDACDVVLGCIHIANTNRCADALCDGGSFYPASFCLAGACPASTAQPCGDGNPCTVDGCDAGGCTHTPTNAGLACEDADGAGGFCHEGVCSPHCTLDEHCADAHACTTDVCDLEAGLCRHEPDDTICSDGNDCTRDVCDPAAGCQNPFDDGRVCAEARCEGGMLYAAATCRSGDCPSTQGVSCDDGDECTDDTCDVVTGCVNSPNTAPCGEQRCEGSLFYAQGRCAGGSCVTPGAESCADTNPCTDDVCDPVSGCGTINNANECASARCEGGTYFASALCSGGACPAQEATVCEDGELCTDDTCDPATGCVFPPNAARCGEGRCEGGLYYPPVYCEAGSCPAAIPVSCADGNECTDDACDSETGCYPVYNNNICGAASCDDDGRFLPARHCVGGACAEATPQPCYDASTCTADSCVPEQGCVFAPTNEGITCVASDGDPGVCRAGACAAECTQDAHCDDGIDCTTDSCDQGAGRCVNAPDDRACDDGNVCTDNTCSVTEGCLESANQELCAAAHCEAGGYYPAQYCAGGSCPSATPEDCDDGNLCTDDSCDPGGGCGHSNHTRQCREARCDTDGFYAATFCANGACPAQTLEPCDDDNVCTDDSCDAVRGCLNDNNTRQCRAARCDGDVFYAAGLCANGVCPVESAEACVDTNACTDNSCDPTGGCQVVEHERECRGARCESGLFYPAVYCFGGACPNQVAQNCDDDNLCTDDTCSPSDGCGWSNNNLSCGDASCVAGSYLPAVSCSGGSCPTATAASCDDGNTCTTDSCDVDRGCQHATVGSGTACDDSDACTLGETCSGTACSGGTSRDCDDGNPCTRDSCDADTGCAYHVLADGTACEATDGPGVCQSGICVCTPLNCSTAGFDCGTWGNGCGGTIDCGGCEGAGEICTSAGRCEVLSCGGDVCPALGGYTASCNGEGLCEYALPDTTGWHAWDRMIWVPANSFVMGSAVGTGETSAEEPKRTVYLSNGYFIDRFELSSAAFADFLTTRASNDCGGVNCLYGDGHVVWSDGDSTAVVRSVCANEPGGAAVYGCDKHPAGKVTWWGAEAYCAESGKRLCTEAEWEYAAAGASRSQYPWGDLAPTTGVYANCDNAICGDGYGETAPVGAFVGGRSWVGCDDMGGNVREWVEDDWHVDYSGAPTDGSAWVSTPRGSRRVWRGGDYNDIAASLRCRTRSSSTATLGFDTLGVRCCASP